MGSFRERDADWLGVGEALERVLSRARTLEADLVEPGAALGRLLAGPVTARATLPPWDNAAMDGYAVRSVDVAGASDRTPVTLRVVGRVRAGERRRQPLGPGEAVRIMTGAPIPPGCDSVIRVEDTDAGAGTPDRVAIRSSRDARANVRPGGRDMRPGQTVLPGGLAVGPGAVGVLVAAGVSRVPVTRRPRVAIVTAGDELARDDFDRVLRGEAVPESNGPMLAAAVERAGGVPHLLPVAPDEPAALRHRLDEALRGTGGGPPDLLLTVGGASMGEADLLKDVLEEMEMRLDFWRVRIRPGSPLSLGWLPGDVPVLSLPGNPASAFVTFHLFARPLLRHLLGSPTPHLPVVEATAGEELSSVPRLCHFHRVRFADGPGGRPHALLTGPTGSGLVAGLAVAHGLAVVPEGVRRIAPGEPVTCLRLDALLEGRRDPGYPGRA
jgi:molybdopterin molybdotransferase